MPVVKRKPEKPKKTWSTSPSAISFMPLTLCIHFVCNFEGFVNVRISQEMKNRIENPGQLHGTNTAVSWPKELQARCQGSLAQFCQLREHNYHRQKVHHHVFFLTTQIYSVLPYGYRILGALLHCWFYCYQILGHVPWVIQVHWPNKQNKIEIILNTYVWWNNDM